MAGIITVLVIVNMPKTEQNQLKNNTTSLAFKTFLLSFAICYTIVYFANDSSNSNDVMQHMLQGEPDF
jgi:uncharacterized membrane protein